jgi:glutathione S-transferase
MMAIKLYSWPRSSGTRVAWALEELGLAYDYVEIDGAKGEHRAAPFLALSPQGKVPALVDGEQSFFESGAILLHLGTKYGVDKQLWPPGGGQPRADAVSWTVWSMAELGPSMMQFLYHGMETPMSYKASDRSGAAAEYSLSQFKRGLDAIESRLQAREHLLGGFTLVDIAASGWLMFGAAFGIELGAHPRTAGWVERCKARPARKRAR